MSAVAFNPMQALAQKNDRLKEAYTKCVELRGLISKVLRESYVNTGSIDLSYKLEVKRQIADIGKLFRKGCSDEKETSPRNSVSFMSTIIYTAFIREVQLLIVGAKIQRLEQLIAAGIDVDANKDKLDILKTGFSKKDVKIFLETQFEIPGSLLRFLELSEIRRKMPTSQE